MRASASAGFGYLACARRINAYSLDKQLGDDDEKYYVSAKARR
jgi:hypothetical protein